MTIRNPFTLGDGVGIALTIIGSMVLGFDEWRWQNIMGLVLVYLGGAASVTIGRNRT